MRQRLVAIAAVMGLVGFSAGSVQAEKITVKEIHLCCDQCEKAVGEALKKVEGVAEVKCDQKTKIVTFTSKDDKTSGEALEALFKAGFTGKATKENGNMFLGRIGPNPFEKPTDEVTVKGVHACCKECQKIIDGLFKDAKVSYSGTGPLKDLKITGKGLNKNKVWAALLQAGFAGKVE
jgi:copper chaperone CopZ